MIFDILTFISRIGLTIFLVLLMFSQADIASDKKVDIKIRMQAISNTLLASIAALLLARL